MFAYGLFKFERLISFEDTVIIQTKVEQHFELDDRFTSDDGLAFAFAFASYDESKEQLDPDYGTLKAYTWQWGFDEEFGNKWTEITTKPCTRQELGLVDLADGDREYLYPSQQNSYDLVEYFADKFRCFNVNETYRIQGEYNSERAIALNI